MKLTWDFILRDLISLISAQFFIVFLIYFTMVRRRMGKVYPYWAAFLVALIVFMGGGIFRLFPISFPDTANLYLRFSCLFFLGLPSIVIATALQSGICLPVRSRLMLYGAGLMSTVSYLVIRDSATEYRLAEGMGFSQEQVRALGIGIHHAHLVQLISVVGLLLMPTLWMLIRRPSKTATKSYPLLWCALSLGLFLTIGTALEQWWIYYTGSTISALFLGVFVFRDVHGLTRGAELKSGQHEKTTSAHEEASLGAPQQKLKEALTEIRTPEENLTRLPDIVLRAKAYMNEHFREDVGVDTVSDALRVSRSHLMAVFKKTTGITLNQYLIDLRMEQARALLLTRTVTEVAFEVGFNSSSYFSTVFKKQHGFTPREFQEKKKVV